MRLVVLAAVALVATLAQAQPSGRLNDTGQTLCDDGSNNMVACTVANTGDAAALPRQDGRFGRDAAAATGQLTKVGGGAAGFDFSCVLWHGTVIDGPNCTAGLIANTGTGAHQSNTPATDWACTKDNHTNLIWSLLTLSDLTWDDAIGTGGGSPVAVHNNASRCGYSTGWRVPTRRELLSIVHRGASNPTIDGTYFPATLMWYWSSDTYALNPTAVAWGVRFNDGVAFAQGKLSELSVRLVHSGP